MNSTIAIFTLTMTVVTPAPNAPLGVTTEKTHQFNLTETQCQQMKDKFYQEAVKYNKTVLVKCEKASDKEAEWTKQQYSGKMGR